MKKFLMMITLVALAACGTVNEPVEAKRDANPAEAVKNLKLGCFKVKGVKDSDHGKIYYTDKHNLFKYVELNSRQGDKGFCTVAEAEKAGFKPAPEHFSGSVYYLIQCLHSEGNDGTCHTYVAGIYKSLEIYGQVCGPRRSKSELAQAVEDYANKHKDGMDTGKYEGTTSALLNKYRCRK